MRCRHAAGGIEGGGAHTEWPEDGCLQAVGESLPGHCFQRLAQEIVALAGVVEPGARFRHRPGSEDRGLDLRSRQVLEAAQGQPQPRSVGQRLPHGDVAEGSAVQQITEPVVEMQAASAGEDQRSGEREYLGD